MLVKYVQNIFHWATLDQDFLIIEATRLHSDTTHLIKHNTQKRERDIHSPVGFEPVIAASKLPQTHSLKCK
jgi:hypothetical protein